MRTRRWPLVLASFLILSAFPASGADGPRYERRWVYAMENLLVDRNADRVVALIERASRAGYNGLVLADYKLNILDRMGREYVRNVRRVEEAAARAKVEIIPAVFPIGYSAGLLAHDANLAEGMPVEGAPFVVAKGVARLEPDPAATLKNGDLEETKGDQFVGFSFQDDPGKSTVADRAVAHHGRTSCRIEDVAKNSASGNCRLIQRVAVRPHACYRLSCWVRTRQFDTPGAFHLLAIGASGRQLTFHEGGPEPTQDWRRFEVVFNSLDEHEVNLYAGVWGGRSGALWIDDLTFEELGLVNVLRRDGCPLRVTSEDGRVVYEEGKDFEPVRDPKLGEVPYAGEYGFDHDGPPIRLTRGSSIREGARLRVSWYHAIATHGNQVMCCLSHPKVYELLRDQARRVEDLLHPKTIFMSHDEIRVANWCKSCRDRRMTPGALLADNVRRCVAILRETSPNARVVAWSDMFDPNHNAHDGYYLVNGTLEGSWEGLAPEVVVANWNGEKARKSLEFFARRGHPQVIAGYYDVDDLSNFRTWDAAARGVAGVSGFMYTTWSARYDLLDAYGRAIREAR